MKFMISLFPFWSQKLNFNFPCFHSCLWEAFVGNKRKYFPCVCMFNCWNLLHEYLTNNTFSPFMPQQLQLKDTGVERKSHKKCVQKMFPKGFYYILRVSHIHIDAFLSDIRFFSPSFHAIFIVFSWKFSFICARIYSVYVDVQYAKEKKHEKFNERMGKVSGEISVFEWKHFYLIMFWC